MLDRCNLLAVLALVGLRYLVPNKLLLSVWVLAFAQTGEVFRAHGPRKSPLAREPALPFAMALLVAAPVVLFTRSKLPRMISPRLACGERFGDGEHSGLQFLDMGNQHSIWYVLSEKTNLRPGFGELR